MVAPAGHAIPTLIARRPSFWASAPSDGSPTPAPTKNDGSAVTAAEVLRTDLAWPAADARTSGSASKSARLPARSTAATFTG